MSSNNQMSKEQFINQIGHVRKREMAAMILDGATFEELESKGFGRTNVQDMVAKIKIHVVGLEGFKVGGETVATPAEATQVASPVSSATVPTPTTGVIGDTGSSESGPSESGPSESGPSDSGSSESTPANTPA